MLKSALLLLPLFSFSVYSASIEYRHEATDAGGNTHRDRLLMSHRFASGFGLTLEGRWKGSTDKDKAFNETVSNGTEVVASYLYKVNNWFQIEPGFSLDSGSNYNNYRPYVRGHFALADDFNWSLRYRPYYKRNSGNIGTRADTGENGYTITSVFAYKFLKNYQVDYEFEYKKTNAYHIVLSNNENYEMTHDIKLAYKIDNNWSPFVAVGNIPGSKVTNERQTRYRIGVKYNF